MSNTTKPLTVFLDNIGRTIIGKIVKQDDVTLSIENPALVHIQANPQTSQLQLQILPLFFREFQADKTQPTVWNYKKANITTSEEIPFAVQFTAQYEQMFQTAQPAPQKQTPVVKLFDEE
ncbi:MAG: hypothetical protein ACO3EY_07030 [Candidatus Nanopelagicales bacterium]